MTDELIKLIIVVLYLDAESQKDEKYTDYKQWCLNKARHYRKRIIELIND